MSDIKTYFVAIAWLAFGWWGIGRNVSVLLLSLVVLFLGATAGLELVFTQYAGQLWLRILAIVFLFLLFVVAPYRLWLTERRGGADKDEQISALQAKISTNAATQELVSALWALRDAGVEIRNERLAGEAALPDWLGRYQRWRAETLKRAAELSPNLASDLNVLDETKPPPAGVNPINGAHAAHQRIMSEILRRLADYLRRFFP